MALYEAVLFDFDGVLVDSEPVHHACWQEILGPFGIELDWKTYSEHCIGITDRAMLTFLCSLQNPPADIELLALEYPRKKEMFRNRMSGIGVAQEIRNLILELRKHFKVGVVTSSNIREIGSILETAGLLRLLDTVVHGGEVKNHKPAPDPYLLAMERLGVTKAVALEDSAAGIASARAAGLDVIAIPDASRVVELLREHLYPQSKSL